MVHPSSFGEPQTWQLAPMLLLLLIYCNNHQKLPCKRRVADGGQFCISLHQQLRLPSADTVNLTGRGSSDENLSQLLREGCAALPGHLCWITSCPSCSSGSA